MGGHTISKAAQLLRLLQKLSVCPDEGIDRSEGGRRHHPPVCPFGLAGGGLPAAHRVG